MHLFMLTVSKNQDRFKLKLKRDYKVYHLLYNPFFIIANNFTNRKQKCVWL